MRTYPSRPGSTSALQLLASSLDSGVSNLRAHAPFSCSATPQTAAQLALPIDNALSDLSHTLSDTSLQLDLPALASPQSSPPRRPWTSTSADAGRGSTPWQRRTPGASRGGGGSGALRATSEEQRLEGLLAENGSCLEEEGIGRSTLRVDGLSPQQCTRLYRVLYLHSCTLQEVLLSLTGMCSVNTRGSVLLKVWKVFVGLVEHLMAGKASTVGSNHLRVCVPVCPSVGPSATTPSPASPGAHAATMRRTSRWRCSSPATQSRCCTSAVRRNPCGAMSWRRA